MEQERGKILFFLRKAKDNDSEVFFERSYSKMRTCARTSALLAYLGCGFWYRRLCCNADPDVFLFII